MIKNREGKKERIVHTVETRIGEINSLYRSGPSLYFYMRISQLRRDTPDIAALVGNEHNLEMLYATLVSWDMNSRGAKMRYFDGFRDNILACSSLLTEFEEAAKEFSTNQHRLISRLESLYDKLSVMESGGKLVSNAKLLHFLFPNVLMPMDRSNTLQYFYGNRSESWHKYLEIIRLSFEIMVEADRWERYLDDRWNQTIPKVIDNAILLLGMDA